MNIKIVIKKDQQKQSILTIFRSDGSSTWTKLHRGLETHDIAHYAVESTLGFTRAFYGIINDGYTIDDFIAPKEQRKNAVKPENLHSEALITEHIVNLLEIELLNSGFNDNFLNELSTILAENNLPFPKNLNTESLTIIRNTYHNFYNQWLTLNDGKTLEIVF